jgi:hypothetical protein
MEETITVMKPEVVKEPVDVQVRSYYWDPVVTYTQRSYRNPATGCTETFSEPRTSFVRREECQTVTKYVERTRMVPVQEKRRYIERTPVTTIYGPTTRYYPKDCDSCGLPPGSRSPQVEEVPGSRPRVDDGGSGRLGPQSIPTQSYQKPRPAPTNANQTRQPAPSSSPTAPLQRKPNVPVNAHTTGLAKGPTSTVRGEVLQEGTRLVGREPVAGTTIVFLNANNFEERHYAKTDRFGQFTTDLPAGRYIVYVGTSADQASKTDTVFTLGEYDSRTLAVAVR